ncbi:MAG: rhomboid family intramembrane serine protease [Bacteroidota bacterium]
MLTIGFVAITVVVSYMSFNNPALNAQLCHHPYREAQHGEYYRMLTGGFVHGSWEHLLINMYVLYQFGSIVENLLTDIYGDVMGRLIYFIFYISAVIVSDIGTFIEHRENPGFRSVGASGVTTGLVFIYAIFSPWQMFLFPPVPAIVFAVLYVFWSQWASTNRSDNIDHLAHLFGGIYGVAFIILVYPKTLSIFWERLLQNAPF